MHKDVADMIWRVDAKRQEYRNQKAMLASGSPNGFSILNLILSHVDEEVLEAEESRHIAITAIPSPHKKDSKGLKNLSEREQPLQNIGRIQPPWIEEEEFEGETPWSGQTVRLKGGPWPWEGFVEAYNADGGVWSPVCDEMGRWNLNEGSAVCRQLGYLRGAEITWQGDWSKSNQMGKVHIVKVECKGQESSLASCKLEPPRNKDQCNLRRDAVGVRCIKEYRSLCSPSEIPYGGNCYSIVMGSEAQQLISKETASKECRKNGASLATITSQEENDFISEWLLLKHPKMYSVITGGVRLSTNLSNDPWVWEELQMPMTYSNWWNGWRSNIEQVTLDTQSSTQCLVTSRIFPCVVGNVSEVSSQGKSQRTPTTVNKRSSSLKTQWCTTDYHFWLAHDCSMLSNGAICKRNPNNIGCVWNLGMDYIGLANVTRHGSTCIHWDESLFGNPHPDGRLQGHNLCRNYGGAQGGGAAEGHPWCYVDSNGAWESCDIPPCRNKGAERSASGVEETNQCGNNEFHCSDEECIANRYVCDGIPDCSNGRDESGCKGPLKEFRHKEGTKLEDVKNNSKKLSYTVEKWVQISAEDCAKYCIRKESNGCNSFSYHLGDRQCLLALRRNEDTSSSLDLVKAFGWDFYELLPPTVNCRGMFHCKNGSCINSSKVCNGINDCGDQSDEISCSLDSVEFSLRLAGSNTSHEGRIEVRAFGRWGVVCDDLFGLADADVVCREAGYSLGAAEVVLHSGFGSGVIKGSPLFLMDDLECIGNEKSLSQCQFSGWGNHNCGPEEVAGVVCKIPGSVCQEDQFHCQSSKECIPLEYLCDNLKDCKDGSDEEAERCQSEVLVRLADGPTYLEGRVEVRYNGLWGTVCDDDFGVTDAQVICRTLGLGWGPRVQALKDAHFGPGKGPIWLDELHCSGDESKIVDCPRFPWGKNNCGHKEDASVRCTAPGDMATNTGNSSIPPKSRAGYNTPKRHGTDFLPSGCGIQFNISSWLNAFGLPKDMNSIQPKVVGGEEFKIGPIPWQASLRVRSNPGKSVHWCGAVILSPLLALTAGHCIQDYSKEAYILRVGDFDAKISEGTEQEVTIEEIYLHEEFNKGPYLNNDIAVIKIKVPGIQFNEHIHAACLPAQEDAKSAGEWSPDAGKCFISGWGSVGSGTGFSRTLRSAVVPLLSPTVCQATHVYGKQAIGEGMGCAGSLKEGSSDSCQGDSGGPLICFEKGDEPILYGITSWGQGCGRANKPGVYSRVSFFRNWVNQKVQEAMSGM